MQKAKWHIPIIAATLFFRSVASVLAQSPCDGALIKDTYVEFSRVHTDWRLALLVDEKTYDEIRQQAGANAVIYGVPVGTDYNDFHTRAESFSLSYNEALSQDQLRNIAWTALDPNSSGNYRKCIDAQILSQDGLHAAVIGATQNDIDILVRWFVPNDNSATYIQWQPDAIDGTYISGTYIPSGSTIIRIPRPKEYTSLVGNSTGFFGHPTGYTTGVMVLEPLPSSPPTPIDKCNIVGDFTGLTQGQIKSFTCIGMMPGKTVNADYDGDILIDGGGTWIQVLMRTDNSGWRSFEQHISGPGDRPQTPFRVTGTTDDAMVPASGTVTVTFLCARAQWGRQIDPNHREDFQTSCISQNSKLSVTTK
jgi:hypothetical protein